MGVSVCRNCCKFGHGADNCGMKPQCPIWAGAHNFRSCHFLLKKHEGKFERIHLKHIKCANCSGKTGNHTATFPNCPNRQNYMESLAPRRQTRPNPVPNQGRQPRPPPQVNTSNYPNPVFYNPTTNSQEWVPRPVVPPPARTIVPQQSQTQPGQDLYSIDECRQMLDDLFTQLKQCKTKPR